MTYSEKLKDPRWQKKRLKVLERDGWRCRGCLDETRTLHIHHLKYGKGEPWEVPDEWLETLCEECHDMREEITSMMGKSMAGTRTLFLILYGYKSDEFRRVVRKRIPELEEMAQLEVQKESPIRGGEPGIEQPRTESTYHTSSV